MEKGAAVRRALPRRRTSGARSKAAAETARMFNRIPKPIKVAIVLKSDGTSDASRVSKWLADGVLTPAVNSYAPIADVDAEGAGAEEDADGAAAAAANGNA